MSTQKKENTPMKGQAKTTADSKNSTAQRTPGTASAQKGKGPDAQRKPEANAGDRTPANDSKRPTANSKKH